MLRGDDGPFIDLIWIRFGHCRHVDSGVANQLKREVYYLGKDLLTAEKELNKLQAEVSGVLQGVERDFRLVSASLSLIHL